MPKNKNEKLEMKESKILEKILDFGRKIIPRSLFKTAQPLYHFLLSITGAVIYGFPAKRLTVIGVTGTKGKSSTTEIINAILESAGKKTAVANTIRYKVADKEWRNLFKMTLRGRFFTQNFLRKAVSAEVEYAIIEISSEGVRQFRHKFLGLDALVFTNLSPEHIESHGSYKNYVNAKLEIAKELEKTSKKNPAIIVNADDPEAYKFLELNIKNKIPYSIDDIFGVKTDENNSSFQLDKVVIHSKLGGMFNVYNMLGSIACVKHFGISTEESKKGIEKIDFIRGRMQKINAGQDFDVVVDYAHTKESLEAIYEAYNPRALSKENHLICILGNTGGGRDKWKRKVMAETADHYCSEIILTNEDPYDEDPIRIIDDMKAGIKNKPLEIELDRRKAIKLGIKKAFDFKRVSGNKKVAVLITGKGTDPYIMEAGGKKTPWDDASVVREELDNILDISN